MRVIGLRLLCLFLLLSGPVYAGLVETIEFDLGNLQIDYADQTVNFGAFQPIRDVDRPAVPIEKRYFFTEGDIRQADIVGLVIASDTIETGFQPALCAADLVTSDMEFSVTQPVIVAGSDRLYPEQSIQITPQYSRDRTIWSVIVFPVQYLEDGRIIFNRVIEIHCGDEVASSISCGLPPDDGDADQRPSYIKSPAATNENGCPLGYEYVIVTSPKLEDAFEEFIDLKIKTGFNAAIALTDSIYAYYTGIDQAEAVRNYLRDFYNAGGRYVLLGGDENQVPVRYAYYYNTDIIPPPDQLMICDLYFADFDGNWDADGDGVWGEPTADQPDIGAEVALGRLPFSCQEQVKSYTDKLRSYLFDPGVGDREYLRRSIFLTSDQMVDYFADQGQQYYVAEKFPSDIEVDCDRLAEAPTGNAVSPTGPFPAETMTSLDSGYGMINILAHGRPDGFVLNSSEYNLFPKSYLLTGPENAGNGAFSDLAANNKIGFYYSISCSQGSFDLETVYAMTVPSVVEELLDLDSAGAVGIIAFSRWGWVGSSYKLMASFYEHLFGDADGYPVEAMYRTYLEYPYYVDQVYGQNYNGDPSLRLFRDTPDEIQMASPAVYEPGYPFTCRLTVNDAPLADQPAIIALGDEDYQSTVSDNNGLITINTPDHFVQPIEITVYVPGLVAASVTLNPSIAADADDDDLLLPDQFELRQNYPNPFNPATTISFSLTRYQPVTLQIYDILGRLIDCPVDENLPAGEHQVIWNGVDTDGNELPSGMYFYRLIAEECTAVKKMMLLK